MQTYHGSRMAVFCTVRISLPVLIRPCRITNVCSTFQEIYYEISYTIAIFREIISALRGCINVDLESVCHSATLN